MADISKITLPNNQTYELRDNRLDNNNYVIDNNYIHTDNNYTTIEKNKLNEIAAGAEVNQNSFSNIKIGSTTVSADNKTDTIILEAGSNIILTPDTTNDKITITSNSIPLDLKGVANGIAQLDSNGLVPSTQLPSYVDDVLEYNGKSSFPTTGQTGKIYVDTSANKTYRWSGSTYVQISASIALGTTSSTAFRGDYGNTAYTHAIDSNKLTTATSSGLYKVASTVQGHIASLTAVTKEDITALGIPGSDTNTDTLVTQTNTTDTAYYRPLLSKSANNTTETATSGKSSNLQFSPGNGQLIVSNVTNTAPFYANLKTRTTNPTAGQNVNILSVQFYNSDGSQSHIVYPIAILGNDSTTDAYNSGVRLGSTNGTTIVGAGESSTTFAAKIGKYNDENLYLTADGHVYMYIGLANDSSTHKGQWLCGGYTATPTSDQVVIADGTDGGYKTSGFTIGKSVPSNAIFTDTTYSAMSQTEATTGTATSARSITAKVLNDTIYQKSSQIYRVTATSAVTSPHSGDLALIYS